MMLEPPMKQLLHKVPSRYELVNVVACRARQISSEAESAGEPLDDKPVSIAIREVADLYYGIKEGTTNANHAWWYPEMDHAAHGFELVGINCTMDKYAQCWICGASQLRGNPMVVYKATEENSPFGNPVPCDPNGVECIHDASDPRLREWVPTGKGLRARFEGEPEWDGSVM